MNINYYYHLFITLFEREILNIFQTSYSHIFIIAQNKEIARNIFNSAKKLQFNIGDYKFSDFFDQIIAQIFKNKIQLDVLMDGYIIEINDLTRIFENLEI